MARKVLAGAITIEDDGEVKIDSGGRIVQRMGPRRVEGFRLQPVNGTTVRIRPGEAKAKDNPVRIRLSSARDIDLNTVGANGRDGGSLTANSWYWIHVIKGPSGLAGLASLSRLNPALPEDYANFRRVGVVRVNGNSQIIKFQQIYMEVFRRYIWKANWATVLNVLSNGQATPDWADVNCQSMVPPSAELGEYSFTVRNTGSVAPRLYIRPKGATYDALRDVRSPNPAGRQCICEIPPGNNQTLEYHVDDTGDRASIHVLGFTENVRE